MKALFTDFLTVGISTSIMITIVLLVRFVFKKAPKALICIMWTLVALRLLLPFQIPANFSIRPSTPVIKETATTILNDQPTYAESELPAFVPVQTVNDQNESVVVDYIQIGAIVWCIGMAGMLGYMVFSYLGMRYTLRESIKRQNGIYENSALPTAFLLGYLHPRIYLPAAISEEDAQMVIRHEQAHLRRGDNWLKLFAYICLAVHWYNPCVWLMYMLLGRDIESACDETVIRQLDEQGRADYSSALLNCGKGKRRFAGCPVTFGEVSVGQRIRNVLSYKKPTLWICIALVIVIITGAVFFLTDPVDPVPPHYNTLSQLIGQPLTTVADKLNVSRSNLIPVGNEEYPNFLLPETVTYVNTDFQIKLYLNYYPNDVLVNPDEAVLHYFEYICEFSQEDANTAAASAIRVGNRYLDMLSIPERELTGRSLVKLTEATEEELTALYGQKRDKGHYMVAQWDLTDTISSDVAQYFYAYRQSRSWSTGAFGEYYPEYYLQLSTGCDPVSDKLYLTLTYQVGTVHFVRRTPYKQLYKEDAIPEVHDPIVLNTSNAEEILVSLIGLDKGAVCAALGISEYDLYKIDTVVGEIYQAPNAVEYYGLDFVLILSFEKEGYLWNIQLQREYPEVTEDCAKDIVMLAKETMADKGKPKQEPHEGWVAHTVTEDEVPAFLVKLLEAEYYEFYLWYLGEHAPENVKKAMEQYGSNEFSHGIQWITDESVSYTELSISWSLSYVPGRD